jgi:hypothetical protein
MEILITTPLGHSFTVNDIRKDVEAAKGRCNGAFAFTTDTVDGLLHTIEQLASLVDAVDALALRRGQFAGVVVFDERKLCDNCHSNEALDDGRCLNCFAADGSEDKG